MPTPARMCAGDLPTPLPGTTGEARPQHRKPKGTALCPLPKGAPGSCQGALPAPGAPVSTLATATAGHQRTGWARASSGAGGRTPASPEGNVGITSVIISLFFSLGKLREKGKERTRILHC